MMLGKRHRPPMRRTSSMSGISVDFIVVENPQESQRFGPAPPVVVEGADKSKQQILQKYQQGLWEGMDSRYLSAAAAAAAAAVTPRNPRRSSADFALESALRACGLCKRRLGPGRDTFMYRGEIAFCSLECRQRQIAIDERCKKKEPQQQADGVFED